MNVAVISCFDTLLERQDSLRRCFTDRGDNVTAYLSDFRHREKTYHRESPDGYTLIHARPYSKNISVGRMLSHDRFARSVAEELEARNWDLIWVLVPPNSLVKRCVEYKRRHPETKLVIDVNDLWPETFPLDRFKSLPPFQWWKRLRDWYISDADHIVTECNLFRKRLGLEGSPRASTIYMCKPADYVSAPVGHPALDASTFSLCYLGSINNIIDIDAIAGLIRSLSERRRVDLHVIGEGESRHQLLDRARAAGANVVFHGLIFDREKKQKIFDQCHFGLNVMKHSVCVGLTMKSIDYLAGGLPIINTIHGDTWELVERYGFGLNWSEGADVDWNSFDALAARAAAQDYFARELTYDRFARKVNEVLRSI